MTPPPKKGFEDLGLGRTRVRGFGPRARQGSRIWGCGAPGFEDLGLVVKKTNYFGIGSEVFVPSLRNPYFFGPLLPSMIYKIYVQALRKRHHFAGTR